MGKRSGFTTVDYITSAALPNHLKTYTTIPHKDVIDRTHEILARYNLSIDRELYRCNNNAEVASGIYHMPMQHENDELTMMFAWCNSYDKSMRFKCSVGAKINQNDSYMVLGDTISSWSRKHTGKADQEAAQHIEDQISNAGKYYQQLVTDMTRMKSLTSTFEDEAKFLGRLFFDEGLLTTEQAQIVRAGFWKEGLNDRSLWGMYTRITGALKKAHPRDWLDVQRQMHNFIISEFDLRKDAPDPAQVDLIDSIKEIESATPEVMFHGSVGEAKLPIIGAVIPDEPEEIKPDIKFEL